MTLLLLVQQLVNSYQNINSYYHSMRRSSVANFSQTQKTDLRSCQKPRTERKEVPPKPSILKRGDKTRYSRADESEADEKMNKITNYFESNSKQKPLQEVHFDQNNSKENKSSKSSDEQFQRIKAVNQSLRSKLLVQKQEKRKIQMTVAANMLEIADIKRKEKRRVDKKLGHFTDNFKRFVEGTLISDLREQLKETELAVSKLNEEKNNCGSDDTQYNCIVSSYQFKSKQCSQIRKELDAREKEMIEYRQKLRLADKQEKSYYSTRGWPIIYNKFQTLQLLGSGGFGEVYKCYDFQKQTIVAIKRMKFDPSMNSRHFQEFCRHVKREMQIQIKLKHPNIAKLQSILEFDEESRCIVFQLQYCRGPELSVYMKKQRIIQEKQAKLYIKQILCALDYLYKLKDKIIHYDLKPSNIIFHEGVIKILDFGLCKKMDGNSDQTKIDLTSQGVGTYWYLPPETFDPYDPMVSPKVDVWSVGVIFFEMIYGKRPFGHGMSQNQVLQKNIIRDATKVTFPPDPSKKNKISEEAKNFIRACLAYDTKDRLNPTEAYEHEYLNLKK